MSSITPGTGFCWEMYEEDRDLYLRDMQAIGERQAFLHSKIAGDFYNLERQKAAEREEIQSPVGQLTKPVVRPEHECTETYRFLPSGWEV